MTTTDQRPHPNAKSEDEGTAPRLTIVDRGLAFVQVSDRSRNWVASSVLPTEHFRAADRLGRDRLLVTDELDPASRECLAALFSDVVSGPVGCFLSIDQIHGVLLAPHGADRALGVLVSEAQAVVVIVRGDLTRLVVPWAWFRPSGDGTSPDFRDAAVIDSGLAIRLGAYEASMDGILYEVDREFRARDRRRRLQIDVSFGGSLRRLRLQRQVSRSAFPGVSDKEIARIERGEVVRPHGATLRVIAQTLGVEPAEIETY